MLAVGVGLLKEHTLVDQQGMVSKFIDLLGSSVLFLTCVVVRTAD